MHFQQSLPRLPIPLLEKTCERYLAALKPILIDESYRKTEDVVNRFKTGSGPQLQKMLKDRDLKNKHTSYISEPWFDMYLRDRVPLPINYNPVLILKNDERKEYNAPLIRATNLIISSLRFMKSLRDECLEPEVFHLNPKKSDNERYRRIVKLAPKAVATYVSYAFKAFPLDMSQYSGLFGATRIPELDKDRIYRSEKSRHLLIIRNGHFYAVDVLDKDGNIEAPNVILGRVKYVLQDNTPANEFPLGSLTAWERNKWATVRHHLLDIGNEKAMKLVDSALFCLCLDDSSYDEANPVPLVRSFLAGDSSNRWFDKSVSIFMGKDGASAINFEHSWGDGVAVLRYFNEIYQDSTKSPLVHPDTNPAGDIDGSVKRLEFKLDDRMKEAIKEAEKAHNQVMDSLDLNFLIYHDINKSSLKKNAVSPDSIIQLSFQLAFKMQYDKYVGTYESCSTAAFKHGRTETMRPCTIATKTFCDAVLSKTDRPDRQQLRSMIDQCSTYHGQLTKEAAMGQGFDRHLFGLRHVAELNGIPKPSIFEDAGYQIINNNILSTSTLSSPGIVAGGFGPVVKDGYGIGYVISNDRCGAIVTSYKGQRNGSEFIKCLKEALDTIRDVLQGGK